MKLKTFIKVEIRDKNGKILRKIHKKCSSYVRAMIDMLNSCMGQYNTAAVDTAGDTKYLASSQDWRKMLANAGAGNAAFGVVVGISTDDVVINDYRLHTQISHGDGDNLLNHGAVSVGLPATVGSSRQFIISRTFTNNGSVLITVNEVGLYLQFNDQGTAVCYFCAERSLLTFDIDVGASATVTYTIKVTV